MIPKVAYLQDEAEYQQKIEAMKQTLQEYIKCNPETGVFRFFLPSDQDVGTIKQAVAKASLETGKPIDLIYPVGIAREEEDA
jgi:hypothetical protein